MSTMCFRCDLQTCAVTVDGLRLDSDGLRGSTRLVSGWWSRVRGRQVVAWLCICCLTSWCLWDRGCQVHSMTRASVCDSGMRESNRTLPAVHAVMYRHLMWLMMYPVSLQWPDAGSTCAAKQHYRCSEFNVEFMLQLSAECQRIRILRL